MTLRHDLESYEQKVSKIKENMNRGGLQVQQSVYSCSREDNAAIYKLQVLELQSVATGTREYPSGPNASNWMGARSYNGVLTGGISSTTREARGGRSTESELSIRLVCPLTASICHMYYNLLRDIYTYYTLFLPVHNTPNPTPIGVRVIATVT